MIKGVLTNVDFMMPVIEQLKNDKTLENVKLFIIKKNDDVDINTLGYDQNIFDEIITVGDFTYQIKKQICNKYNINCLVCSSDRNKKDDLSHKIISFDTFKSFRQS